MFVPYSPETFLKPYIHFRSIRTILAAFATPMERVILVTFTLVAYSPQKSL